MNPEFTSDVAEGMLAGATRRTASRLTSSVKDLRLFPMAPRASGFRQRYVSVRETGSTSVQSLQTLPLRLGLRP